MIRRGIYTVFKGIHLGVTGVRDDYENVCLEYIGEKCPLVEFEKSRHMTDSYLYVIDKKKIVNAYAVWTFGIYKGFRLHVYHEIYDKDLLRIMTDDPRVMKELGVDHKMGEVMSRYLPDIPRSEFTRLWEERRPCTWSELPSLPMPEGLAIIQELEI